MLGRLFRRPPPLEPQRPEPTPPAQPDEEIAAVQQEAEEIQAARSALEELARQQEAERRARRAELGAKIDQALSSNSEQFLKNSQQLGGQ
jgi:hypothetical protein